MIRLLKFLKKISLTIIQTIATKNSNSEWGVAEFNVLKQAPDFFRLYPEWLKTFNQPETSFVSFYTTIIKAIEAGDIQLYSIMNKQTQAVTGFVFLQKVCPFIMSMRIVIAPDMSDVKPLNSPLKKFLKLLFMTETKQVIVFTQINNKKEFTLLRKLGFRFFGKNNHCMAFSLEIT